MTPQELKNSILQLAIQGKLVEQRADEGTGAELLEKIFAAKNAEDAKKNLTRSRGARGEKATSALSASPREEISDDEKPFDIPESWEWARLRDVCIADISYGIIKLGAEDQSGVKVLRCSDVKENYIDARGVRTVSRELSSQYERTLLTGGEIIINVRGTLGGCSVVPMSMAGYNVAREVAVVRQNTHMDAQYIVFILLSRYFQSFMSQGLRGIAYKGLNMGTLSNFPIPLPPLAEQKRIVAKLEELLPLCERLKSASNNVANS
jgi:type I restriction enzyme S subunit